MLGDSKGREPIESEAATASQLVLIPCCVTKSRHRDSFASSAPSSAFLSSGFLFWLQWRQRPHQAPRPHSSIHPFTDSCSHSTFLPSSLALCQALLSFPMKKKYILDLTRQMSYGWGESVTMSKYPGVCGRWALEIVESQTNEDSTSQNSHRTLICLFHAYVHACAYIQICNYLSLLNAHLFMEKSQLVHFRHQSLVFYSIVLSGKNYNAFQVHSQTPINFQKYHCISP